jgi:hypothetical protein
MGLAGLEVGVGARNVPTPYNDKLEFQTSPSREGVGSWSFW